MKYSEKLFQQLRNKGWSFNDDDKENFLQAEHQIIENMWKKKYIDNDYQLNNNEWQMIGFMSDLLRILLEEEL